METRDICWTLVMLLGLAGWLYVDLKQSGQINYAWHSFLINSTTGEKIKPVDVYDLGKLIKLTDSYVNSTNAIERLYDLEYNLRIENPFPHDQIYSNVDQLAQSGWPVADQAKCGDELKWISDQLAKHQDYRLIKGRLGYELTQLMDTFGRPEAGSFSGVTTWPGSYKQCRQASLDGGRIKTRYCFARMRPKGWPDNEADHLKTRIRVGVCLPETCDTMSFARQKETIESLVKFDLNQFYRDNLEIDSLFCLPDERSPIRQIPLGGRIYLFVVATWLSIVVIASIAYEIVRRKQRRQAKQSVQFMLEHEFCEKGPTVGDGLLGRRVFDPSRREKSSQSSQEPTSDKLLDKSKPVRFKLLEVLSVHQAIKDFKSDNFAKQHKEAMRLNDEAKSRVNLCSLSAIKFIMAIFIVLGHSGYLSSAYFRSHTSRIEISTSSQGKMSMSVPKFVDTFFVFFGLLTSYNLLKKFAVKQLSNPLVWIGVNACILIRIWPVFMLTYWYSKLISPYTSHGPWWDYGVYDYSLKGFCMRESWWRSIPYFGCTGLPSVETCVLPAWFLTSYAQLSLIMPLFTYILYKLPNHITKLLLIMFAMAVSCSQLAVKMLSQSSIREEGFTIYGTFLVDLLEKFESTGTMATLGRVGSVCVGCYGGYLLKMYEDGKIRRWPRWFRSKLTINIVLLLHVLIMLLPFIGHLVTVNGEHQVSLEEFIISYVVTIIVWPILNLVLVVNTVTVYNRLAIVRFCGHSFWHSANKLGLCLYLIHWEVLYLGIIGTENGTSFGFVSDVIKVWSYGVVFSILLAFAIHILIDAPVTALLMLVVRHIQEKLAGSSTRLTNGHEDEKLGDVEKISAITK